MLALSPDQEQIVKRVTDAWQTADKVHQKYRPRWERFFGLWSNYTDTARQQGTGKPRDWDAPTRHWAQREWGAELFIPMAFSTVETVVPRVVSNRPRMLVQPRPRAFDPQVMPRLEDNAENLRVLIDSQQSNGEFTYDLVLQDVAKDGLIYGVGFQKTYWKRTVRNATRIVPHVYTGEPCWQEHREVTYDDPYAECVDPFDIRWDPRADSVETADYMIHRYRRDRQYVTDMLASKTWDLTPGLSMEDIGTGGKYDDVSPTRDKAQGLSGATVGGDFEIWEFHDGAEVIWILDRKWPVRRERNMLWHGELPFQAYRPTRVGHQMVGVGEIQPIVDLQLEMNTMRSQRRDNATLKLMQSFFYSEAFVDPANIKFGAGVLIPVEAGIDPREVIMPVQVGDIPFSSYREEDSLRQDFDRTSGISDLQAGADPSGGVSSTATGAQLVEANSNQRIALKARRLTQEVVVPTCRQWIQMNQRQILNRPIRRPVLPTPEEPERKWQQVILTPEELKGEFAVAPEGGQEASDNPVQRASMAQQQWVQFANNPLVDQRALVEDTLRKLGHVNPQALMAAQAPQPPDEVPPEALDFLQKRGVPAQVIAEAVQAAKADQMRQQQGQQPLPSQPQAALPPAR